MCPWGLSGLIHESGWLKLQIDKVWTLTVPKALVFLGVTLLKRWDLEGDLWVVESVSLKCLPLSLFLLPIHEVSGLALS
jgi:hypothetical protein